MASRNGAFDSPKPEVGIADWASKIREMQRQVDADEEAEQRKLEEEIAASRLRRMSRRSNVVGSHSNSLDISKSREFSSALEKEDTANDEEPKSATHRQAAQADALRKLGGGGTNVSSGISGNSLSQRSGAPPQSRPEPMSLAAFMGGRATGPRLNKHAPQQDAHDPTQFDQRSVRTIQNAPHPIFGRGGVGLPGMAASSKPTTEKPAPAFTPSSEPSKPPPVSSKPPLLKAQRSAPQFDALPKPSPASSTSPSQPSASLHTPPLAPTKQFVTGSVSPSLRNLSTTPEPKAPRPASTPSTPTKVSAAGTSPTTPPKKAPVSTPSLARPVLPAQKPASPIPASKSTSPAFQRSTTPKDLTPSLSRLQGRGFVQSMVKASSQLSGPSATDSSPVQRPPSAGRKPTVLDRWQPSAPATETSSPPSPRPMRKSWTVDSAKPPSPTKPVIPVLKSSTSAKDLSKGIATPVKLPAMGESSRAFPGLSTKPSFSKDLQRDSAPPVKLPGMADPALSSPGLGSKSTFVVMQPAQSESTSPVQSGSNIDEFGSRLQRQSANIAQPSPRPLVHPTRDRAKPARNKGRVTPAKPSEAPARSEPMPTMAKAEENVSAREPKHLPMTEMQTERPYRAQLAEPMADQSPTPVTTNGTSTPLVSQSQSGSMADQVALPTPSGVPSLDPSPPASSRVAESPGIGMGPPPREKSPRHTRIPSTGNRARVMDLAQAMHEYAETTPPVSPSVESPKTEDLLPPARVRNRVATPERRRSTFEQSPSLFPLKEEATPLSTPVGTLSRAAVEDTLISAPDDTSRADINTTPEPEITKTSVEESNDVPNELMNEPLPHYDLHELLNASPSIKGPDATTNTISVEVMSIIGTTASNIGDPEANIFYDSEVLVIVRRYKSASSGLVGTTVWAWVGRKSQYGDSERRKLQEVSKRYGTMAIYVRQGLEPLDLLSYIKQPLSIRQGSRAHWSPDNQAMHSAREIANAIVVLDEHDLHIKNLCSGFSFCVSILNTQYVWHGRGSRRSEQEATLHLARQLAPDSESIVELREGEEEAGTSDMLWMMLGDEDFAAAQYWSWRSEHADHPRCYLVHPAHSEKPISLLDDPSWSFASSSVYLVDCIWEYFVVVGHDARHDRRSIRLAIAAAKDLSSSVAPKRPFSPPVNVLALPSLLPPDLRLALRSLDESLMNGGNLPDHMNLLPWQDALSLMSKKTWNEPIWATARANLYI